MPVRKPSPANLEPIERASADELRALQLERMRWSLAHAYDNVPHYRAKFDACCVARRSTSRSSPGSFCSRRSFPPG
jgi:phenylacetate-CoA ligase